MNRAQPRRLKSASNAPRSLGNRKVARAPRKLSYRWLVSEVQQPSVKVGSVVAEVERLLGIGAMRHPRIPQPDEDFIMLADPEGNSFCVIEVSEG